MENPVQKPYIHQEYPKRMYLEGDVETSIVVNDPDEEDEGAEDGYTTTWINHAQAAEAPPARPSRAVAAPKTEKPAAPKAGRVKMPPPPKAGANEKDEDEGDAE